MNHAAPKRFPPLTLRSRAAISQGGGVYARTVKAIPVTAQARTALGLPDGVQSLSPAEYIHAILQAPVDLLWNGGIGTYVKATSETHADAGDRANDAVRVDATQVRARCAGEGGNLGWTQAARIEYSRAGGRINTDFIDNSAGVDTSDHEVNIKILLTDAETHGRLTDQERNVLLPEMTDDVAALVLAHNVDQNQALAMARYQAARFVAIHEDWMRVLSDDGYLDRHLETMPSTSEMTRRIAAGEGLCSPELATLFAWTKIRLADIIVASDLPDDPYLADRLIQYFPKPLRERFGDLMGDHPLRREIITTVAVNRFVNSQGISSYHRLSSDTGASAADIIRAQLASRSIFRVGALEVGLRRESLDAETYVELMIAMRHLVERGTRWVLQTLGTPIDVAKVVETYVGPTRTVLDNLEHVATQQVVESWTRRRDELVAQGCRLIWRASSRRSRWPTSRRRSCPSRRVRPTTCSTPRSASSRSVIASSWGGSSTPPRHCRVRIGGRSWPRRRSWTSCSGYRPRSVRKLFRAPSTVRGRTSSASLRCSPTWPSKGPISVGCRWR